jgi:septal ring factor EnvC (AmiA/AmiB activator)
VDKRPPDFPTGWLRTRGLDPARGVALVVALSCLATRLPAQEHRHGRDPAPPGTSGTPAAVPDLLNIQRQLRDAEGNRAAAAEAQRAADDHVRDAALQAQRLANDRVAAAARLRDTEAALQQAAEHSDDLARQRAQAEQALRARGAALAPLLPLAERLSLYPTETMLTVPLPPEEAVRGALVLRGLAAQLESDARQLRTEQDTLARLDQEQTAASAALRAAQVLQVVQAAELDRQIGAARDVGQAAEDAASEAARRVATVAARADSLRAVMAELEAARRSSEAKARMQERARAREEQPSQDTKAQNAAAGGAEDATRLAAAGTARLNNAPVAGRMIRAFGDPTDAGPARGISYEPAPAARVVAPCRGRAVFAAPFRSFGQLLILDCGGSYHFVLAGLERLDVEVGHLIQAGEPVGVMANWDPGQPGPRPALYVELRRAGQPVDPSPWLRAHG